MRMQATIQVTRLCKRFWPAVALDGLSFTVLPLARLRRVVSAWPGPGLA